MTEQTSAEIIVNVFGRTDVGRTREHNEDSFVVADLNTNIASLQPAVRAHKAGPKGTLFMVADGMGGAAAGEIASQMATDIVLKELRENWLPVPMPSPEIFARCLKRAAQSANKQIHTYATSHQEYRGMGTTATIAGFLEGVLYLAQVGDSRGYLIRDGEVRQITKDQSLMQKLIEAGELTEEEAAQSERRNIILQALGPEAQIKVDLTYQPVCRGDILLMCSDGLSGQITKDDIKNVLTAEKDLVTACKKLIDIANANGGPDNITVILSRFEGEGLPEPSDDDDVSHKVFAVPESNVLPGQPMARITEGPTAPMRPSTEASRSTLPVDQPKEAVVDEPAAAMADAGDAGGMDAEAGAMAAAMAPTPPDVGGAVAATVDSLDTNAMIEQMSPKRRSGGRLVAIALIVLLVAAAGWYGYRTLNRAPPDSAAMAPDSAATTPDSAAPAANSSSTPPRPPPPTP